MFHPLAKAALRRPGQREVHLAGGREYADDDADHETRFGLKYGFDAAQLPSHRAVCFLQVPIHPKKSWAAADACGVF